jgi:hypothetical protein
MPAAQTQSLPTWAPICKPTAAAFDDEDPLYLSGEETDCDSERGSDTLSREDQQLLASFINLQRERKQFVRPVPSPAVARAAPVLIPTATRKYEPSSSKQWVWDDVEDHDDLCSCCHHRSVERRPAEQPSASAADAVSDLLFELEL